MPELTYDTSPSRLATTGTYYPLRFKIGTPELHRVRATAAMILASYCGKEQSFTNWRAAGSLVFLWKKKGVEQITRPFRFETICRFLAEHGEFSPTHFNFPDLMSSWLDASVMITPKFHARSRLVEGSNLMFEDRTDWLLDLFAFFATVVATVDNTLHQIYCRAKYGSSQHGWTFAPEKLGPPHARRIEDKLRWVDQITGRPLNCASDIQQFLRLKSVRNHLAHFDPPAFAFTIEDLADWLNASTAVARMLAAMRRHLAEPLCSPLVKLLLAKTVEWYPWDPGKRRVPQRDHVGYASSVKPPPR